MTDMPELKHDIRCDWWCILNDLQMHGMSMEAISSATFIPKSTVAGYKNLAVEPKHADGERILMLWRSRMVGEPPTIRESIRIRPRE